MKQLTIEAFKAMLDNALKQIKAREEEFSKLDAVIGDGDHGTAIVAAMTAVNKSAQSGTEFKQMLGDMGMDVMIDKYLARCFLLGYERSCRGNRVGCRRRESYVRRWLGECATTNPSETRRQDDDGCLDPGGGGYAGLYVG